MSRLFGAGTALSMRGVKVDLLGYRRRGADPSFDERVFQPAYDFANGTAYGARVYSATAVILETLRRSFGEARFDTAMGVYARRFRFKHPKPADFFATLDEECGLACGQAARQALDVAGGLDVYVERIESAKKRAPNGWFEVNGARVEKKSSGDVDLGWANAAWIGRRGAPIDLPVDVELRYANGRRQIERVFFGAPDPKEPPRNETWARIDADGPDELVAVVVDPELKIPMDRTRMNNFSSVPRANGGAPVTRERAFAWIETLVEGAGP